MDAQLSNRQGRTVLLLKDLNSESEKQLVRRLLSTAEKGNVENVRQCIREGAKIDVAKEVYDEVGSFNPWSVYKKGLHQQYL